MTDKRKKNLAKKNPAKKNLITAAGISLIACLLLAGCSGGSGNGTSGTNAGPGTKEVTGTKEAQETKEGRQTEPEVTDPSEVHDGIIEVTVKPIGGKENTFLFDHAGEGDVLVEGTVYCLTVKEITEEKLILQNEGLIEKNADGTINLRAEQPKTFEIAQGSEIKLATQTTDGGYNVTVSYKK